MPSGRSIQDGQGCEQGDGWTQARNHDEEMRAYGREHGKNQPLLRSGMAPNHKDDQCGFDDDRKHERRRL